MTLVAQARLCGGASATKDSEHESGYYEDGSDVEERRRAKRSDESGKWSSSSCSRSCGLAKAIHELDVRDSPASPDPDDDEDDEDEDDEEANDEEDDVECKGGAHEHEDGLERRTDCHEGEPAEHRNMCEPSPPLG
jgi:hypothetical protein